MCPEELEKKGDNMILDLNDREIELFRDAGIDYSPTKGYSLDECFKIWDVLISQIQRNFENDEPTPLAIAYENLHDRFTMAYHEFYADEIDKLNAGDDATEENREIDD